MQNRIRVFLYPFYWLVIAPLVLTIVIDLFTYLPSIAARLIWGPEVPAPAGFALQASAVFGLVVGVVAVVWFWRHFRESVARIPASGTGQR
jgi:hypothetical protein